MPHLLRSLSIATSRRGREEEEGAGKEKVCCRKSFGSQVAGLRPLEKEGGAGGIGENRLKEIGGREKKKRGTEGREWGGEGGGALAGRGRRLLHLAR